MGARFRGRGPTDDPKAHERGTDRSSPLTDARASIFSPGSPGVPAAAALVCAVIVIGAALACGGSKAPETNAGADGAAKDGHTDGGAPSGNAILIGHYGSMTGSEATFGQSTSNGVRLALKEFNDAGGLGGRTISLKEYDTQGKTEEAGTAVTRLCTNDKVTAILGRWPPSLSIAGGSCRAGERRPDDHSSRRTRASRGSAT
jgi:ABC-type branched-subunit amino acid transport system substrate-binding protein